MIDARGQEKTIGLASRCPVCSGEEILFLLEILEVPVYCNVLWPSQVEAVRAPRGNIQLGFCETCCHVFNLGFNPRLIDYTGQYENSLHFSPRFQQYAESVALRLVSHYSLYHKTIVEIGCGKGDFLILLCKLGGNHGLGFDPSYVPEQGHRSLEVDVTFIQDYYSERYAHYPADFICCRHVLEHIYHPRDFLSRIYHSVEKQSQVILFFEVPNVLFTLKDGGIWDLIYEHASYFSPHSLACLFAAGGFETLDLSAAYEGQFLTLETRPGRNTAEPLPAPGRAEMATLARTFADKYQQKIENWQRRLQEIKRTGRRVVAWGGGSKGVTFLNTLKTQDQINYIVDINPRKQGLYVAGTGQRVVAPEFLQDYRPDGIIVMNPIYQEEIRQFAEGLGLGAELITV